MSLASPYQEHYYVADGVTTSFSFGEYFTGLSQAYVKCIIYFDDGTNCVPTFTVDMTTGFITIVTLTKPDGTVLTVPPAGSIVRVFRDTPEQQNVTASQLQNYTAKQLERIFDSVVAMIQEVSYSDLHKTIRLTETQRDVSMEQLKEENDQAILYWDFETRQLKATDYGQNQVVKSDTVDRLVYLQPEGKIYFIPKGSNNPIAIGSATIHNDLSGRNAPDCHPESAITNLTTHLQELRDADTALAENVQTALNRSQEAKDTADEAKGIAEYAQTIAEDAKDIAEDAKETAEGIEDIAEEAKDIAQDAKDVADEALDKVTQEITDREDADEDLQDQIDSLSGRGRFLALWNCATGLAESNPPESPYLYKAGDYFIVGVVSTADPAVNYKPDGSSYTTGVASTVVETGNVGVDDVYLYDGTNWLLQINTQKTVTFSAVAGSPYDNTNLSNALNAKQDTISDLATIRSNAQAGKSASDTIATYGDVVTHNASEFASSTNRINGAPLSNATSNFYGVSNTAAATVQKEVSIPSVTTLDIGTIIIVQPTVTSTVASSTLKLNDFPAYPMRYNNAAITTSTDSVVWSASFPSIWVFDGTYWVFAGHGLDSNTTYTLNYSLDAGQYTAGSGSYAITRYSIVAQKADGTWEKITATNASHSVATSKSVNTNGFILNQLRYYGTTTVVANGALIAANTLYEKSASVDMRYSTNCGGTTTWALGDYIYLVGTIGADGLFYLDTTTWWSNALPTTNDGKLYIRLGLSLTAAGYTMSFFDDRPIFYHDGTGIKEYKVADNKQDVISDLATIRSGAGAGATAVQPGDLATVATTGSYNDLSNKPTIPTVNDATLTIQKNGTSVATFTANASSNVTANISVPTTTNDLTNNSGFITSSDIPVTDVTVGGTSVVSSGVAVVPAIPTVNNPTITITQGGVTKGSFTLNQASGDTIALDAGGGGSVDIDNTTITTNADQEIQAVAVIDQNTGVAKTWTGTMAEYEAIVAKDPETEYIITDDIGGSATEIGQITESLNDKVDKGFDIVEFQEPTADNNYTWYKKYRNGWVEQGQKKIQIAHNSKGLITLPVVMANTDYIAQAGSNQVNSSGTFGANSTVSANAGTTTQVRLGQFNSASANMDVWWEVKGMAA